MPLLELCEWPIRSRGQRSSKEPLGLHLGLGRFAGGREFDIVTVTVILKELGSKGLSVFRRPEVASAD